MVIGLNQINLLARVGIEGQICYVEATKELFYSYNFDYIARAKRLVSYSGIEKIFIRKLEFSSHKMLFK